MNFREFNVNNWIGHALFFDSIKIMQPRVTQWFRFPTEIHSESVKFDFQPQDGDESYFS